MNKSQKIYFAMIYACLSLFLVYIAILQFYGLDVYESEGAMSGKAIGPIFNELRALLGDTVSALVTLVLAFFPAYGAFKVIRG